MSSNEHGAQQALNTDATAAASQYYAAYYGMPPPVSHTQAYPAHHAMPVQPAYAYQGRAFPSYESEDDVEDQIDDAPNRAKRSNLVPTSHDKYYNINSLLASNILSAIYFRTTLK